jgi:hypothetical protein
MPRNKTTGVTQPLGVRCDMAIPANRGCRSQCRPVVASVAAKVSSASNRAWLGNGCRTAARLRVGPPAPAVPYRPGLASVPAWRSPRVPAQPWGWWPAPRPPRTARPDMRQPSPLQAKPEPYRGSFVRLIVKSSPSLASRWKLPPGPGTREMGFNSSYPGCAPPTPHRSRLGETQHAHIVHGGVPGSEVSLDQLLQGSFSSSASASSRWRRSRPPASSGAWWHQPARQERAVACSDGRSSRPPSTSAALWLQPVSGACVQPGVRDGRNGLVGQAFSLEEVLA